MSNIIHLIPHTILFYILYYFLAIIRIERYLYSKFRSISVLKFPHFSILEVLSKKLDILIDGIDNLTDGRTVRKLRAKKMETIRSW